MASLWIIDGYNLLRQSPRFSEMETRDEQKACQSMLAWLDRFSVQTGEKLCVVFDAYSDIRSKILETHSGKVKVLFSRGAYTADEEIIEMAREKADAAIVITSDRAILKEAIRAKASVLNSLEFEREVNKILLNNTEDERESEGLRDIRSGNAFRPPQEKKKAYQLLRKYYNP